MVHQIIKYYIISFLILFSSLYIPVSPLYADIYLYIDSQGIFHFTNVPTSSNYKMYLKECNLKNSGERTISHYDHFISKAAKKHGLSFPLLKALIKIESDFNPTAVSKAGAKGLMQIMPDNLKALNINDPFDPQENIMGGARYLKKLLRRFEGKLPLALAAYNAGPDAVERYKRIPPFEETENFVKKVMKYYATLKR